MESIQASKAVLFSKVDAKPGYHQIKSDEDSKVLTTLITSFGRFRYERAPLGMESILDHYNRRMHEALEGIPSTTRVVDDTLVHGSSPYAYLANVRAFPIRCRECKHQLNEKFVSRSPKSGTVISLRGYKIQDSIVDALRDFPEPMPVTDMRSFFGSANQLGAYDPSPARELFPINHLLKKTMDFHMTDSERQACVEVKRMLTSGHVLAF